MKIISLFTACLLCLLQSFAIHTTARDTVPGNIKKYTKAQFLNEFGKDETSEKIIRYYFYKRKNAKQSLYIFPTLTLLSGVYLTLLANESHPATTDDGYIFLALLAVGYVAGMFLGLSIQAAVNRRKYSPEKLYKQLMDYQSGKPLPKKLNRQIKHFTKQ